MAVIAAMSYVSGHEVRNPPPFAASPHAFLGDGRFAIGSASKRREVGDGSQTRKRAVCKRAYRRTTISLWTIIHRLFG